jgi:hypothetical protein
MRRAGESPWTISAQPEVQADSFLRLLTWHAGRDRSAIPDAFNAGPVPRIRPTRRWTKGCARWKLHAGAPGRACGSDTQGER